MKTGWNRVPALLGIGLVLVSLPVAAANAQAAEGTAAGVITKTNSHAKGAGRTWTAQRFAAARPLPLQRLESGMDSASEAVPAMAGAGVPLSAAGRAPIAGILADDSNRLFEAADLEIARAEAGLGSASGEASGSAKGYFTSSRLVPTSADRSYPYSTVGKLFFHIDGEGDFYCSAAVVRARLVATAAQCVHGGAGQGFFDDFEFVPAYRDGAAPYDTWRWEFVVAPSTWTGGNGRLPNAADYALIEVTDLTISGVKRKVGDVVGFLGYQTQKLRPNHAHLLGYPSNFDGGEKVHQVTAQALRNASANNVEYGSDMRGGSAGGPLIQDFGDNANLVKWIGAISYYNNSTTVKVQGASIPDSRFTSILNVACSRRSGNC